MELLGAYNIDIASKSVELLAGLAKLPPKFYSVNSSNYDHLTQLHQVRTKLTIPIFDVYIAMAASPRLNAHQVMNSIHLDIPSDLKLFEFYSPKLLRSSSTNPNTVTVPDFWTPQVSDKLKSSELDKVNFKFHEIAKLIPLTSYRRLQFLWRVQFLKLQSSDCEVDRLKSVLLWIRIIKILVICHVDTLEISYLVKLDSNIIPDLIDYSFMTENVELKHTSPLVKAIQTESFEILSSIFYRSNESHDSSSTVSVIDIIEPFQTLPSDLKINQADTFTGTSLHKLFNSCLTFVDSVATGNYVIDYDSNCSLLEFRQKLLLLDSILDFSLESSLTTEILSILFSRTNYKNTVSTLLNRPLADVNLKTCGNDPYFMCVESKFLHLLNEMVISSNKIMKKSKQIGIPYMLLLRLQNEISRLHKTDKSLADNLCDLPNHVNSLLSNLLSNLESCLTTVNKSNLQYSRNDAISIQSSVKNNDNEDYTAKSDGIDKVDISLIIDESEIVESKLFSETFLSLFDILLGTQSSGLLSQAINFIESLISQDANSTIILKHFLDNDLIRKAWLTCCSSYEQSSGSVKQPVDPFSIMRFISAIAVSPVGLRLIEFINPFQLICKLCHNSIFMSSVLSVPLGFNKFRFIGRKFAKLLRYYSSLKSLVFDAVLAETSFLCETGANLNEGSRTSVSNTFCHIATGYEGIAQQFFATGVVYLSLGLLTSTSTEIVTDYVFKKTGLYYLVRLMNESQGSSLNFMTSISTLSSTETLDSFGFSPLLTGIDEIVELAKQYDLAHVNDVLRTLISESKTKFFKHFFQLVKQDGTDFIVDDLLSDPASDWCSNDLFDDIKFKASTDYLLKILPPEEGLMILTYNENSKFSKVFVNKFANLLKGMMKIIHIDNLISSANCSSFTDNDFSFLVTMIKLYSWFEETSLHCKSSEKSLKYELLAINRHPIPIVRSKVSRSRYDNKLAGVMPFGMITTSTSIECNLSSDTTNVKYFFNSNEVYMYKYSMRNELQLAVIGLFINSDQCDEEKDVQSLDFTSNAKSAGISIYKTGSIISATLINLIVESQGSTLSLAEISKLYSTLCIQNMRAIHISSKNTLNSLLRQKTILKLILKAVRTHKSAAFGSRLLYTPRLTSAEGNAQPIEVLSYETLEYIRDATQIIVNLFDVLVHPNETNSNFLELFLSQHLVESIDNYSMLIMSVANRHHSQSKATVDENWILKVEELFVYIQRSLLPYMLNAIFIKYLMFPRSVLALCSCTTQIHKTLEILHIRPVPEFSSSRMSLIQQIVKDMSSLQLVPNNKIQK